MSRNNREFCIILIIISFFIGVFLSIYMFDNKIETDNSHDCWRDALNITRDSINEVYLEVTILTKNKEERRNITQKLEHLHTKINTTCETPECILRMNHKTFVWLSEELARIRAEKMGKCVTDTGGTGVYRRQIQSFY